MELIHLQFNHAQIFVTTWTAACNASLFTNSQSLLKLMSIESVMPANHLILCRPLLLHSIFLIILVFFNESVLHIRWPKYWSLMFSISPSNEYSELFPLIFTGLISSLPKEGFSTTVQKKQFFSAQLSLWFISPIYIRLLEKQKL